MGHSIRGIIAKTASITASHPPGNWPVPFSLLEEYSIIPMFDEVLDEIFVEESGDIDGFSYLNASLQNALVEISTSFHYHEPFITPDWRERLHAYLGGMLRTSMPRRRLSEEFPIMFIY